MYTLGFLPIASGWTEPSHPVHILRLNPRENKQDVPLRINLAFDQKEWSRSSFKHRRDHFGESIGLAPKTKGQKLDGIPTIQLAKRKKEYPPSGHDIYEADATRKIWKEYRAQTPYPDPRGGKTWKPFHKLNPARLQHIVGKNDSVIIRDEDTDEIIGVVIRNFSGENRRLLDWINGIIAENTGARRSVRVGPICNICLGLFSKQFPSWRTLGTCARLAILLVHATALNLGGRGIC